MFRRKNKLDVDGLNEVIYLGKNILKLLFICLIVSIILVVFILFKEIGIFKFIGTVLSVISPLFIGFIVAWLFAPLVLKMTKKGVPRILASIIVYVVFIAFLVVFFRIFIPIIYTELNELISTLPAILDKITVFIEDLFKDVNINGLDVNSILSAIEDYGNMIASDIPTTLVSMMSSLFSGLGSIFFGLIIGLYMLFDFDNVTVLLLKLIPKRYQVEVLDLVEDIGREVRKCVNGTLLVACMVFVCDTIGFSILGLNSALLFGLFCGITDLIPYIGPYIGTAVAAIVAFTQSPLVGIGVLIVAIVVQLVESYILQPVVMSKATKLHPVTIICGLLIFGHFFGIVGMILAVPVMSIFKVIWRFLIKKFELFQEKVPQVVEE